MEEKKIKKQNSRIALRISNEQREQINQLVNNGDFKNLSHVVRVALKKFFSEKHSGETNDSR